jgi:hypothetical protein
LAPRRLVEMPPSQVQLASVRSLVGFRHALADQPRPVADSKLTARTHSVVAVQDVALVVVFDRHLDAREAMSAFNVAKSSSLSGGMT